MNSLKSSIKNQFGTEINFGTKTTVLGIFDFRAFLNLAIINTHYGISLINYVDAGIKIGARLLADGTIKLQLELIN